MKACVCPSCGSPLEINENEPKEYYNCKGCGTTVSLDDFKGTIRIVDEARLQEDETKRILKLKEYEQAEKKRKDQIILFSVIGVLFTAGLMLVLWGNAKAKAVGAVFWLLLICFLLTRYRFKYRDSIILHRKDGKIRLTENEVNTAHRNYMQVQNAFADRGFLNIEMVNLRDLKTTLRKKPGTVENITIEGTVPYVGGWYDQEAKVVITYHGMDDMEE